MKENEVTGSEEWVKLLAENMNQSSDYEYGADHVAPNDYLGGEKPDLNNIFIVQGDSSSVRVSTFFVVTGR